MGRIVCGSVFVLGLLLAFGLNVISVVCDVTALIVLGGAVHYLARGRLPQNFWLLRPASLFGPPLVASILHALYVKTVEFLFSTFGRLTIPVLCLGFVAVSGLSFLYARSEWARLTGYSKEDDSLDERKPVLRLLRGKREAICDDEEGQVSDSYSDYSIEE